MPDPKHPTFEEVNSILPDLRISSSEISFRIRRTKKIGDDYSSFEASESWSFHHDKRSLTPAEAQHASAVLSPKLIMKMLFALVAMRALSLDEFKYYKEEILRMYGLLTTEPKKDDTSENSGSLSGTGLSQSSPQRQSSVGSDVSPQQDGGVQDSPGSDQHSIS